MAQTDAIINYVIVREITEKKSVNSSGEYELFEHFFLVCLFHYSFLFFSNSHRSIHPHFLNLFYVKHFFFLLLVAVSLQLLV